MIEACCLDVDMAALCDGDLTLIGDRGVTLSGGQRQRVSLARAVYSDRDVYLLDDPLAAVDPDVALAVFRRVVLDLLNDKTVLLVTHQPQVVNTEDDYKLHCWRRLENDVVLFQFFACTEHTRRSLLQPIAATIAVIFSTICSVFTVLKEVSCQYWLILSFCPLPLLPNYHFPLIQL